MAKKEYTPEQVINKLREVEILLSQGETIAVISKKINVQFESQLYLRSPCKYAENHYR